jgi:hypothetical protein
LFLSEVGEKIDFECGRAELVVREDEHKAVRVNEK